MNICYLFEPTATRPSDARELKIEHGCIHNELGGQVTIVGHPDQYHVVLALESAPHLPINAMPSHFPWTLLDPSQAINGLVVTGMDIEGGPSDANLEALFKRESNR